MSASLNTPRINRGQNGLQAPYYNWTGARKLAVGASSAATAAINSVGVLLCATVPCLIKVGAGAPTAADGDGCFLLPASAVLFLPLKPGEKIAAIRQGGDNGALYILPGELAAEPNVVAAT